MLPVPVEPPFPDVFPAPVAPSTSATPAKNYQSTDIYCTPLHLISEKKIGQRGGLTDWVVM